MPDNREWALLIWLGVALLLMVLHRDIRSSLLAVVRIVFTPVLLIPVLLMAGWVVGLVFGAARIGWWEAELTTNTAEWFVVTALVLMFSVNSALSEEHFFRRTVLGAIGVAAFVGVFINLYVLTLWAELLLLPVLVLLSLMAVVARRETRFRQVQILVDTILAVAGFALFAFSIFRIVTDWNAIGTSGMLQRFSLPIWLTLGIVPFVYLLSLYAAYQGAFSRIDFRAAENSQRWRVKLALAWKFHFKVREIAAFTWYWARQAADASTFRGALRVIDQFRASQRQDLRQEAEQQERLVRYAGVDGVDDDDQRLDRREFKQTKDALRALATAQMGWYRHPGNRYRPELLGILESRFERCGLPPDHGISLQVGADGQSWWAYRRTVSGWCFAIGAATEPPDEWLYDGPEPPSGPPGGDAAWGERWGVDAKNWQY